MVDSIIPVPAHDISNFERGYMTEPSPALTDAERAQLAEIAEIIARASSEGRLNTKAAGPNIPRPMTETEVEFIETFRGHSIEFLEAMLGLFKGVPESGPAIA